MFMGVMLQFDHAFSLSGASSFIQATDALHLLAPKLPCSKRW